MGLHAVLHRPADSSPSRKYPGLLLVPGGLMAGASWHATWRKSNAWNFVDAGLIVLIYDARGRGWSGGEEDFDGPIQQDDLATVIEWLNARDDVLPGAIGVASSSWGITVASGALSRHPDLPARFLVDLEGAGDRYEMTQWDDPKWLEIMHGHSTSDDEFWKDREAIRFVGGIACPYFRLQSNCDHAFDRFYVDHAINMVNGAVNGESPYVRLNDMPPNRTYDLAHAHDYHWFPVGDTDETFYYAVLGAFCTTTHL
jgi:pimeloyl-ACP methyl ester carboxylesterase